MLRRSKLSKATNENENDKNTSIAEKNKRDLGLTDKINTSILGRSDSALKLKETNSERKLQTFGDKSSIIPVKRQQSQMEAETKKKQITSDRTLRRHEKEAEWEPESLDLDFSVFDESINEPAYEEEQEVMSLSDLIKQVEDNESDFPNTVEYGPPKEKEDLYVPKETVNMDVFDCWVDLDGYELVHMFQEEEDFTSLVCSENFNQLPIVIIEDDKLEFSSELTLVDDLEVDDDVYNPFINHKFDVQEFIKSN